MSDAITVLLLLKPDSEPSEGMQQPQAVLWEGWLHLAQGQLLTVNAAQQLVHNRMAGCVSWSHQELLASRGPGGLT